MLLRERFGVQARTQRGSTAFGPRAGISALALHGCLSGLVAKWSLVDCLQHESWQKNRPL